MVVGDEISENVCIKNVGQFAEVFVVELEGGWVEGDQLGNGVQELNENGELLVFVGTVAQSISEGMTKLGELFLDQDWKTLEGSIVGVQDQEDKSCDLGGAVIAGRTFDHDRVSHEDFISDEGGRGQEISCLLVPFGIEDFFDELLF